MVPKEAKNTIPFAENQGRQTLCIVFNRSISGYLLHFSDYIKAKRHVLVGILVSKK